MKQKLLFHLFGIKPVKGEIKPLGTSTSVVPKEYLKMFPDNGLNKMYLRNVKTI